MTQPGRLTSAARRCARLVRGHRLLFNLAALAVTAAFSYLALRDVDLSVAWGALRSSDWIWLAPALGALALSLVARALRWRSLFAPGRQPPLGTVANAMMLGYLYNNILPARSGEVARVLVLSRRSGTPAMEITGTAVLERLYDLVGILVIFFVAEPWLPPVSWLGPAAIAAGALALIIMVCALVLAVHGEYALRVLMGPAKRLPGVGEERFARIVPELTHGLSGLRNRRVAVSGLFWTVAAWMLSALAAYLVSFAFHLGLPFSCGLLVTVAIGLAMVLPAPPAAVGVFEGAVLIGLKTYGLSHSAALPYAVVLHLVNFLPFILVGALLLHYNARHSSPQSDAVARESLGGERHPNQIASAPASTRVTLWRELPASQADPVELQAGEG